MLCGGVAGGGLELRRLDGGHVRVAGAFPYGAEAVLAEGPTPPSRSLLRDRTANRTW